MRGALFFISLIFASGFAEGFGGIYLGRVARGEVTADQGYSEEKDGCEGQM